MTVFIMICPTGKPLAKGSVSEGVNHAYAAMIHLSGTLRRYVRRDMVESYIELQYPEIEDPQSIVTECLRDGYFKAIRVDYDEERRKTTMVRDAIVVGHPLHKVSKKNTGNKK